MALSTLNGGDGVTNCMCVLSVPTLFSRIVLEEKKLWEHGIALENFFFHSKTIFMETQTKQHKITVMVVKYYTNVIVDKQYIIKYHYRPESYHISCYRQILLVHLTANLHVQM